MRFYVTLLFLFVFCNLNSLSCSDLEYMDNVINYNKNSRSRCNPSYACNGIDIKTIPYMFGHTLPSFATENRFFDMEKTRNCLKNKRIVLLGDSTMGELFHDLAILLSGIAYSPYHPINTDELDKYIIEATRNKGNLEHQIWSYELKNDVAVKFFCCRRNLTITAPSNINIHYRYIGHYDLPQNYLGIRTLTDYRFQSELMCILGYEKGCPRPDFIIVNSGHHDRSYSSKEYTRELTKFFLTVKKAYWHTKEKPPVILWKSNLLGCRSSDNSSANIELLDQLAYQVTKSFSIPFVNITEVLRYVPRYAGDYRIYTGDCIHYGSILRSHNLKSIGTVSMLISQRMLREMCIAHSKS